MAVTPVYAIPYVESSDLVANYPGVSESLAEQVEDKLPTYAATAPSSPSVGQVWIDSSGSPIGKVWDGSAWTIFSGAGAANFTDTATGTYTDGGINYKYITYTGTGTVTFDVAGFADVLAIGGGAGGGNAYGAGGAGGYLAVTDAYFSAATHTVTIGSGGAGAIPSGTTFPAGANGIASSVGSFFAVGGGAGAGNTTGAVIAGTGFSGGSGGGGGDLAQAGGSGTSGQGFAGGTAGTSAGGGGGGASSVGANAVGTTAGAGGAGQSSSITGSAVTRAGGGGGGTNLTPVGAGGAGGGGAGSSDNTTATAGTVNTGSGGGGGGYSSAPGSVGGAGGSGVVIIRVVV